MWTSRPSSSYRPRRSEPTERGPFAVAETADDAVRGLEVLDLDHPFAVAGVIRLAEALGHDAVESGAAEFVEPVVRRPCAPSSPARGGSAIPRGRFRRIARAARGAPRSACPRSLSLSSPADRRRSSAPESPRRACGCATPPDGCAAADHRTRAVRRPGRRSRRRGRTPSSSTSRIASTTSGK